MASIPVMLLGHLPALLSFRPEGSLFLRLEGKGSSQARPTASPEEGWQSVSCSSLLKDSPPSMRASDPCSKSWNRK